MKAKGNGTPQQCVQNLILITRGEVPYERIKGLASTTIDKPAEAARPTLRSEIEFLIETYEPRANLKDFDIEALAAEAGSFQLNVEIENNE
ncbi:MAG: early E1A protein [Candidatus Dehalobacter alkaniphilus]